MLLFPRLLGLLLYVLLRNLLTTLHVVTWNLSLPSFFSSPHHVLSLYIIVPGSLVSNFSVYCEIFPATLHFTTLGPVYFFFLPPLVTFCHSHWKPRCLYLFFHIAKSSHSPRCCRESPFVFFFFFFFHYVVLSLFVILTGNLIAYFSRLKLRVCWMKEGEAKHVGSKAACCPHLEKCAPLSFLRGEKGGLWETTRCLLCFCAWVCLCLSVCLLCLSLRVLFWAQTFAGPSGCSILYKHLYSLAHLSGYYFYRNSACVWRGESGRDAIISEQNRTNPPVLPEGSWVCVDA